MSRRGRANADPRVCLAGFRLPFLPTQGSQEGRLAMAANSSWADYRAFKAKGDKWVPPINAMQQLGWSHHQLACAIEDGTLWLGGDKLAAHPKNFHGLTIGFISQRGINRIKATLKALKSDGSHRGSITFARACKLAGCNETWVRELIEDNRERMPGLAEIRPGLSKNNRVCKQWQISEAKFKKLLQEARDTEALATHVPTDRMTLAQAVRKLGVNESTAFQWCYAGGPYGNIGHITAAIPTNSGPKPGLLLLKADVDRIFVAMRIDISKQIKDSTLGRLLPEPDAMEEFGKKRHQLRRDLSLHRITGRKVPHYNFDTLRTVWTQFYSEASLTRRYREKARDTRPSVVSQREQDQLNREGETEQHGPKSGVSCDNQEGS
jgi:hypothetical protein